MPQERIVAVALLTRSTLEMLGNNLRKVYPVEDVPRFAELLNALDEADREQWGEDKRRAVLQRLRTT